MKKILFVSGGGLLFLTSFCYAGFLDNIFKDIGLSSETDPDENRIISGLKEALSVGTANAVNNVSQINGYLDNQAIKIIMPQKIQKVSEVLKKIGYQKEVDEFTVSMNRAAEKAAPKATSHFVNAVKEMKFDDAKKILGGGETAATDYFKTKTFDKLYGEFKPVISSSMNEAGVTRYYKGMMDKYTSLPFVKGVNLDLDHYVTNRALDGLFYMISEEEKKIRTDPAARVTDVLKEVFGK